MNARLVVLYFAFDGDRWIFVWRNHEWLRSAVCSTEPVYAHPDNRVLWVSHHCSRSGSQPARHALAIKPWRMMAQAIPFEQFHGDDVVSIMDDAMTDFLREMDELEALDVSLKACVGSPTAPDSPLELALTRLESENGSPPLRPQRKRGHAVQTRKERHDGRVRELQSEIDGLYDQLKSIHDAQQLKEARTTRQTSDTQVKNWKRQATHERLLKSQVQEENRRLRKRIEANESFSDAARRLVNKQKDCALVVVPERLNFVLMDNDTRVYAMLKANLDTRSLRLGANMNRRLMKITQQCVTATMQAKEPWFPIQRDAGVDFEESRILPFSAAIFSGSLARHTQFDTISGSSNDVCVAPQSLYKDRFTVLILSDFA